MTEKHHVDMMTKTKLSMIDKYIPLVQGILDENEPHRKQRGGEINTNYAVVQIPPPTNLVTLMASVLVDAMLSTFRNKRV